MLDWLLSFVVLVIVLAIVIILVRWLLSLTGLAIPQPLLVVGALLLCLVVLIWLFSSGPFISLGHAPRIR